MDHQISRTCSGYLSCRKTMSGSPEKHFYNSVSFGDNDFMDDSKILSGDATQKFGIENSEQGKIAEEQGLMIVQSVTKVHYQSGHSGSASMLRTNRNFSERHEDTQPNRVYLLKQEDGLLSPVSKSDVTSDSEQSGCDLVCLQV